jgi:CubicO group peptidase (beta-lactamase class C family)
MNQAFARPANVRRDEAIVHIASLCMVAPWASQIRTDLSPARNGPAVSARTDSMVPAFSAGSREGCIRAETQAACAVVTGSSAPVDGARWWAQRDFGTEQWYCSSRLDGLARELAAEKKAACAVVVGGSVHRGSEWLTEIGAAGRLSEDTGDAPVTASTWFDLASLTKPIVALAAVRLARAGSLRLDAPLGAIVPEVSGTASASVPLELLLAHRAGLASHCRLYCGLANGRLTSRSDALIEAASARRPDAVTAIPDTGFEPLYSDLGYLLAGEAVARAAGRDLDVVLEQQVIAPLDAAMGSARQLRARDAGFDRSVAATEVVPWRGGTLRGVVHDENAWFWSSDGASGHAGLFGNVASVLAVGRAVVDALHGRLSWFLTRDELWPLVMSRPGGTLRAGFDGKSAQGSSSGSRFGPSTIGHLGFTGTSLWCDVEREMVGVLLTNRVHPSRDNDVIRKVRPSAYDAIGEWAERRRR